MRSKLSFVAGFAAGLLVVGAAIALALGHDRAPELAQSAGQSLSADLAADAVASPTTAAEPDRKRGSWPRATATSYDMRSPAGNRAVRRIVDRAAKMLKNGRSREAVLRIVKADFYALSRTFDEARDTTVCEATAAELSGWLDAAGEEPIDACDEFQG